MHNCQSTILPQSKQHPRILMPYTRFTKFQVIIRYETCQRYHVSRDRDRERDEGKTKTLDNPTWSIIRNSFSHKSACVNCLRNDELLACARRDGRSTNGVSRYIHKAALAEREFSRSVNLIRPTDETDAWWITLERRWYTYTHTHTDNQLHGVSIACMCVFTHGNRIH